MSLTVNRRLPYFLAFLPPAIVLIFLSIYKLDYFGLDYDELLFANAALGDLDGATFVQQKWGNVVIIVFNYIGALKSWIYIPIFKAFGVDAWSARLPMVILLFVNVWLSYKVTLRYFNRYVAFAVFLLLSFDLTFITLHRLDKGPSAIETCIKLLVLLAIGKPESFRKYAIIVFLLVLGVFNKVNFFWIVNALYGVTFLMNLPDVSLLLRRKLSIREFAGTLIGKMTMLFFALVACYVGYVKFLGLHPASPPATVKLIVHYLTLQLKLLKYTLLSTRIFYLFGWDLRNNLLQQLGNLLLVGTILVNALLYFTKKVAYRSHHTAAGFFILIMFAQIMLTVEATNAWHTFMVYPVIHIFILNSFYLLINLKNSIGKVLFVALVGIWSAGNLFIEFEFYKRVNTQCVGGELFIPQMKDLISYTKKRSENKILSVSWGVNNPLLVTGENKKTYYEPYHLTFSRPHLDQWYADHRAELSHPDSILLVAYVMKQNPVFGKDYIVTNDSAFRRYERMIRANGQEPYLKAVIKNQCGNPVYEIYKLRFLRPDRH